MSENNNTNPTYTNEVAEQSAYDRLMAAYTVETTVVDEPTRGTVATVIGAFADTLRAGADVVALGSQGLSATANGIRPTAESVVRKVKSAAINTEAYMNNVTVSEQQKLNAMLAKLPRKQRNEVLQNQDALNMEQLLLRAKDLLNEI